MDRTQERLADYCLASNFDCLSAESIHGYERHLLDSMGCALGALDAPTCAMARRLAARVRGEPGARMIGVPEPTSLEMAAFANGTLIRYLDFNDSHRSGHPSDGLGALLAVAEGYGRDGRQFLAAMHVLYEVYGRLTLAALLRERGWDQGTFLSIGIACAVARLLDLTRAQMAETIALAASDNAAIRQTRSGELSYWKGCATANSARNAVFAALLAQEGMTGPTQPFEGHHGFWEQISDRFEVEYPPAPGADPVIADCGLKYFPVENQAQGPAWAAQEVRRALPVDEIEAIDVETYQFAWKEIGRDPEKWAPRSRETADHSLPYIFATVLKQGTIAPAHFEAEYLEDPWVRAMMQRITVRPSEECDRRWPAENVFRIAVRARDGRRHEVEVTQPRGHPNNPMTDEEVLAKYEALASGALAPASRRAVVDFIWSLDRQPRVAALLDLLEGRPA
jgi:2-methylcitrate dehydratase